MDPKDWFSNCKSCNKRYETRYNDNGLCEDCNNKVGDSNKSHSDEYNKNLEILKKEIGDIK